MSTAMKLLYCLLLLLAQPCLSQSIIRTVLDANTHAPVPYATVKVLNSTKGEIATAKGEFQILIEPSDTVLVSSIGYQTTIIPGREISSTIILYPAQKILEPVTVRITIPLKTIILGNGKDLVHQNIKCRFTSGAAQNHCWHWGPSDKKEEFAEKILLDSSKLYRLLKIYVPTRNSSPYGPLLLKIYAQDSISGMPGDELFFKYVSVNRKTIYKNKVVINLSPENFYITGRKEVFISLGWPPGESSNRNFTALSFFEFDRSNTYSRNLVSKTYSWYSFGVMINKNGEKKRINSAYAVELEEHIYK